MIFAFLSFSFVQSFGQTKAITITGKITDETGKPLPGTSILVKSSKTGTISNQDGAYSISAEENSVLVFSSISYETQEIPVSKRSVIDISMQASNKTLNEVVVVGYGTQSKRAITGAVASVGFNEFKDRSFSNVTQSLAGKIAGVNITQSQGAPGVALSFVFEELARLQRARTHCLSWMGFPSKTSTSI
ncbi:carboxypeptidase-like regulatory domain-containing protein [Spirosoma telluris]|uniref:carboxypeptidase-like regulatory domain-containing protein n=1 Tax=Spirosoma telluris TaxID=2183553 RepID=UPI002FC30079